MDRSPSRRGFLATVASLGLGGCTSTVRDRPRLPETADPRETPTGHESTDIPTETPHPTATSEPGSPTPEETTQTPSETPAPYSGATIPETDHPASRGVPLATGPHPDVDNPILTADDVTDFGDVTYVADPFLFVEEGEWHLFFEVYNENRNNPDAPIGYAHSTDGRDWEYDEIVLAKDHHTSFPLVWKWEGEYYMCPPTGKDVELWKARSFPHEWEHIGNVLDVDFYPHDPVFFRHGDRWWLFTDYENRDVMAYYSDALESFDWTPHAGNPVVTDRGTAARQAGRPVVVDGTPHLFFQDCAHEYGDAVRAYAVEELSPTTYADRERDCSPVLAEAGVGWNADGMHTYDPWWVGDGWVGAVDGKVDGTWSIGLFYAPATPSGSNGELPADRSVTEAYFALDAEDGVVVDRSGSGRSGMVYGAESATRDGVEGIALPGSPGRVVFPHACMDTLETGAFTLLAYVATEDAARTQTLLEYGHPDVKRSLRLERTPDGAWTIGGHGSAGDVAFAVEGEQTSDVTQLALTYEYGSGLHLSLDGVERGRGPTPGEVAFELNYLVYGADQAGETPWNGWLGPAGLFSTALSERELTRIDDRIRSSRRAEHYQGCSPFMPAAR